MDPHYLPVRSATNSEGQLLSLLPLAGDKPDLARPIQPSDIPQQFRGKLRHFDDALFTTSVNIAAQVGLASSFDSSVGSLQDVLVQDIRVGVRYGIPSSPATRLIHSVYWGSALRLTLRATSLKVSSSLSLGSLAAQAQLGNTRIDYELSIQGHAAANPGILATALRVLPVTGTFDVEVHAEFTAMREELVRRLVESTPREPSKVIGVEVVYPLPASTLDEVQARRFVNLQLHRKKRLTEALAAIPALHHPKPELLERMLRQVYAQESGLSEQDEVPEKLAEAARGWLYV